MIVTNHFSQILGRLFRLADKFAYFANTDSKLLDCLTEAVKIEKDLGELISYFSRLQALAGLESKEREDFRTVHVYLCFIKFDCQHVDEAIALVNQTRVEAESEEERQEIEKEASPHALVFVKKFVDRVAVVRAMTEKHPLVFRTSFNWFLEYRPTEKIFSFLSKRDKRELLTLVSAH